MAAILAFFCQYSNFLAFLVFERKIQKNILTKTRLNKQYDYRQKNTKIAAIYESGLWMTRIKCDNTISIMADTVAELFLATLNAGQRFKEFFLQTIR